MGHAVVTAGASVLQQIHLTLIQTKSTDTYQTLSHTQRSKVICVLFSHLYWYSSTVPFYLPQPSALSWINWIFDPVSHPPLPVPLPSGFCLWTVTTMGDLVRCWLPPFQSVGTLCLRHSPRRRQQPDNKARLPF